MHALLYIDKNIAYNVYDTCRHLGIFYVVHQKLKQII
jgi:hypothetical protein